MRRDAARGLCGFRNFQDDAASGSGASRATSTPATSARRMPPLPWSQPGRLRDLRHRERRHRDGTGERRPAGRVLPRRQGAHGQPGAATPCCPSRRRVLGSDPVWFFITDWFAIYLVAKGFALEDSLMGFWVPFLAADLGNFFGGGLSAFSSPAAGASARRARRSPSSAPSGCSRSRRPLAPARSP